MIVNDPEVKAEVEREFAAYETALVTNDVEALDRFFWDDPLVIRYGGGENLYGYDEIAAFRAGRSPAGLARTLERPVVTTFGSLLLRLAKVSALTTKYLSVSIALPGPIMGFQ